MMKTKYSLLVIMVIALLATSIMTFASFSVQASSAQISTDKTDYAPSDTVVITGSGFLPNHNVALTLTGPTGFTTKTWNAQTDANGNLQTTYNQGLMQGIFNLQATDGTNTATTTFTDKTNPTVTVTFDNNPVNLGSSVIVTADVLGTGSDLPTGAVTFSIASGGSGTFNPSNGKVTSYTTINNHETKFSITFTPAVTSTNLKISAATTSTSKYNDVIGTSSSLVVNSALVAPTASAAPTAAYAGQSISLSMPTPTTGTSPYSYEWKVSSDNGVNYNDIPSGASSQNPSYVTVSAANLKFEVIITDNTGAHVTSNVVPVTVNQITITPSHDGHSSITPNTVQNIAYGGSKSFTYSADVGYSLSVLVDGGPISLNTYPTSYTFSSVSQSHTIAVSSVINTFTITVTQGLHGTIAPDTSTVDFGSNNHFTITPDSGYHIVDVVVDRVSKGAVTFWDFNNVQAAHIITASFAPNLQPTTLTIGVTPTVDKYMPDASGVISGYLTSQGTGVGGCTVSVRFNDGSGSGWQPLYSVDTYDDGSYFVYYQVYPTMANGYVVFEATFAGDDNYVASGPIYTGAVGEQAGNLHVVPEYIFGSLTAIGACFVGIAVFKKTQQPQKLRLK
jgi:hypothetical protein